MNERRILVAYDGSEEAYLAFMQAADTARAKGAAIGIVTVLSAFASVGAPNTMMASGCWFGPAELAMVE